MILKWAACQGCPFCFWDQKSEFLSFIKKILSFQISGLLNSILMIIIRLLLPAILFLIVYAQVYGQLIDPVSFHITDVPDQVKAGERFEVTVRAEIKGDWHLYSALNDPDAGPFPTTFTSTADNLMLAGKVSETEPRIVLDPNFNAKLGWHSGEAFFTVPVVFDTVARGKKMISLNILYQVCDDRSCLPPKTKQVSREITVAGVADVPFVYTNPSSQDFFLKFYSFPSVLGSPLENREWIFWMITVITILGMLSYRWYARRDPNQKHGGSIIDE